MIDPPAGVEEVTHASASVIDLSQPLTTSATTTAVATLSDFPALGESEELVARRQRWTSDDVASELAALTAHRRQDVDDFFALAWN